MLLVKGEFNSEICKFLKILESRFCFISCNQYKIYKTCSLQVARNVVSVSKVCWTEKKSHFAFGKKIAHATLKKVTLQFFSFIL